jgi:hypothetical protein
MSRLSPASSDPAQPRQHRVSNNQRARVEARVVESRRPPLTNSSRAGLVISPIWFDDHMIELRVVARNAAFAGAAFVYASHGTLPGAALRLAGFPSSPTDRRELVWGTKSSQPGLGWAKLSFFCADKLGHPLVRVELQSAVTAGAEEVTLLIPVEAARRSTGS